MEVDPALLAKYGLDQETFDRLRKTSPHVRAYTREEYQALSDGEIWGHQCRASLARSIPQRIKNGFFYRPRPIMDDLPHRAFATMSEYRQWCHDNLAGRLGFKLSGSPI